MNLSSSYTVNVYHKSSNTSHVVLIPFASFLSTLNVRFPVALLGSSCPIHSWVPFPGCLNLRSLRWRVILSEQMSLFCAVAAPNCKGWQSAQALYLPLPPTFPSPRMLLSMPFHPPGAFRVIHPAAGQSQLSLFRLS